MENRVGQQIGNYHLVRLLGQGGFADVYLGQHLHLNTLAAIKILQMRLVGNNMEQFRIEAQAIASLVHPHIVRILDFGVENGIPFLVMDYAPGGTVRSHHPRGTRLPPGIIVSYVKQVAEALQYAHDKNLIHRDVKPENMLLGQNNNLLLSDFGLVLVAQSSRSRSIKEIAGTVSYMAPEQIQGKPRPASDQYALGIIVYEWLSGTPPFQGAPLELYGQHLHASPPSLREKIPELPRPVEEVVMKALAKDPQQRFAGMQAFAAALEQAFQGAQSPPLGSPLASTWLYQSMPATIADAPFEQRAGPNSIETSPGQPLQQTTMDTPPGQSSSSLPSQAYLQIPKTQVVLPVTHHGDSAGGPRSRAGRRWLVAALVILVLVLIFGSIAYAMPGGFLAFAHRFLGGGPTSNRPLAASSATVTITPASRDLKNLYTIPAVTGTPDPSQHQVQARQLSNTTSPQSQTANATGSKQNPAVQASGTLVVACRASDSPITITVGTVFTGHDGVQVTTDVTTTASGCSTTISAHAVQAGTSGNIQADDMDQPYGGYVINNVAAFTGGQDRQTYSEVQQSDIDGAANTLTSANTPDPQQALQSQIHPNEQLVSSPQCNPNVSSDHAAGDIATRVTVTVTFTCTGEVYDQQGARAIASQWLKQDAARNPGPGYTLVGKVVTMQTKAQVSDANQGTIVVSVTAEGVWVYQFSTEQERALSKLIAGKKKKAALTLLLQRPGVSKADVKLSGGDENTFPSDSKQIKFVVLSVAGK